MLALLSICMGTVRALPADGAHGRILSSISLDRDTIDFGFSMAGNEGAFVFRPLYFVNEGTVALVVRDTFLSVLRLNPTNSVTEFATPGLPLDVTQIHTISSPLKYDSLRCFSTTFLNEAPEGFNRVLLRAKMAMPRNLQSDSVVVSRDFVLQFYKTKRPVFAQSVINFDSVYVGALRQDSILLRNTDLKRTVQIEDTSTVQYSGSRSAFSVRDNPLRTLALDSAQKTTPIRVQYKAVQRGLDSLVIAFEQYNPSTLLGPTGGIDSTRVILRGVGVEQDCRLSAVRGARAQLRGDTVDVGSFTVGILDTFRLVFANNSNFNYSARTELSTIVPTDTLPFSILDSLTSVKKHVRAAALDSTTLVFHPTRVGQFVTKLVLHSDVADRMYGVPDSVREQVVYLKGEARPRYLSILSSALEFDSVVVFDECPARRTLNLRVKNSSQQSIQVTAPLVLPASAPFSVEPPELSIAAGAEGVFQVHFIPRTVSLFDAEVELVSPVDDFSLRLAVAGEGVEPHTMNLSSPVEIRSFPGHSFLLPLRVDPKLCVLAQSFQATISFDSSLIHYDGFDKVGTAAAAAVGNQIVIDDHVADRIIVKVLMPEVFAARDTLIKLLFHSSLGFSDRCDISVSEPRFGLGTCANIMPSSRPQTSFLLDSLCGLQSKLPQGPLSEFVLGLPSPNPCRSESTISYCVAFPTRVRLEVINSIGTVVKVLCDEVQSKGLYKRTETFSDLVEGVYYIKLTAGIYQGVERIVVSR